MRAVVLEWIRREKLIAIVRGVESEKCLRVADALYEGGVRLMELTYDQREPASWTSTARAIGEIAKRYEGRMLAGAGTVTSARLVEMTAEAGGSYIISPNTNIDVIRRTVELGLVSIPGAMTPSEILTAHDAGADLVKLYPAAELKASYLRAIRAPISNVDILATGGIDETNAREFMDAGAAGLGVGGKLANRKWIEAGELEKITAAAESILAAIR